MAELLGRDLKRQARVMAKADEMLNKSSNDLFNKFDDYQDRVSKTLRECYGVAFSRESSQISDPVLRAKHEADGERCYRAVQPRVDGRRREWAHYLITARAASAPLPRHDNRHTGGAAIITDAFRDIPDNADVWILIRSFTGLSTDYGTFRLLLEDLRDRRKFNLSLYFWSRHDNPFTDPELLRFTTHFQPISEGTLGYGLEFPVMDFIRERPNDIVDDYKRFCDRIEHIKAAGTDYEVNTPWRIRLPDDEVPIYDSAILENIAWGFDV